MSQSIGGELPERARALLDGRDVGEHRGLVITLMTVDDAGYPHASLLSPGEILAVSSSELRLALFSRGTTLRNIDERERLALALVEPELCCYVKGVGRISDVKIPPDLLHPFMATRVDVVVTDVLIDSEVGASIATGPRYERAVTADDEFKSWERVWKALRE